MMALFRILYQQSIKTSDVHHSSVKRHLISSIILLLFGILLLAIFMPTVIENPEVIDDYYKEGFSEAKVAMTMAILAGMSICFGLVMLDVHRRSKIPA